MKYTGEKRTTWPVDECPGVDNLINGMTYEKFRDAALDIVMRNLKPTEDGTFVFTKHPLDLVDEFSGLAFPNTTNYDE